MLFAVKHIKINSVYVLNKCTKTKSIFDNKYYV